MSRLLAPVAFAVCLATGGCTIAGTAIGASMPRYESTQWPNEEVATGREVRVHMKTVGADVASLTRVEGRYAGVRDGLFVVVAPDGAEREIPLLDIVAIDVRDGTEWKEGLVLGALADVCASLVIVAATTNANFGISTSVH